MPDRPDAGDNEARADLLTTPELQDFVPLGIATVIIQLVGVLVISEWDANVLLVAGAAVFTSWVVATARTKLDLRQEATWLRRECAWQASEHTKTAERARLLDAENQQLRAEVETIHEEYRSSIRALLEGDQA